MEIKEEKEITEPIIDWYTIALLFFVAAMVLFVMADDHKGILKYSFTSLAGCGVFGILGARRKARIVRNDFDGVTKALDEVWIDSVPCTLLNKGECTVGIDGLNTGVKDGYVYKVANGVDVAIEEDGSVHPTSIGGRVLNALKGGWTNKLNTKENAGHWGKLY